MVERRKCSLPGKTMTHGSDNCLLKLEEKIVSVESGEGADGNFLLISREQRRESPFMKGWGWKGDKLLEGREQPLLQKVLIGIWSKARS